MCAPRHLVLSSRLRYPSAGFSDPPVADKDCPSLSAIIGATGQVGGYLARLLRGKGYRVHWHRHAVEIFPDR